MVEEKESKIVNNKTTKNAKPNSNQGLDSIKFKTFFTEEQKVPDTQNSTNDDKNAPSNIINDEQSQSKPKHNMSDEEIKYMIFKLKTAGFEVQEKPLTYRNAIPNSNGGSGTCHKNIFFSKAKRKNNPPNFIEKSAEFFKQESLIIKNILDKKRYLNPFLLSKDVKSVLPLSINSVLLPYGDIRVYFKSKNDVMELKYIKVNKVFGPESKLEIFNKSIHKVVIHYVPTYISDEDVNTHFKDEGIGISEIKSKTLKNNEFFKTLFVSLNDINTQNALLEKKWLKICNKKFKISKYINKKNYTVLQMSKIWSHSQYLLCQKHCL